jgi:DnaJ-class molecular chaperone
LADDPYQILGVPRDATEKQIRSAFLKLAKSSHPDLNPGDPGAEARFKAINAAHALLSDPATRARFDRGEIDAAGQERPPPGARSYRAHAEGAAGSRYRHAAGDADDDDLGDILSDLFGARGAGGARRGRDRHYALTIPFLEAMRGATERLTLPEGGELDVHIPPGIESGQHLRLRGKGEPGRGDAPPGDALIEITVAPHKLFRRVGRDIHLDLPVSVSEAVLGARVPVPTLDGRVMLTIPPGSDTGTRLRLRGKGVPASGGQPAGDGYVTLHVMLGPADEELAAFLRNRHNPPSWDPRAGLEDAA